MDRPASQTYPLLIDTNIFLEFLLKQEQSKESLALMKEIEHGRFYAYVTSFALHSIEVILDRARKQTELKRFLLRVTEAKGLTVYPTSPEEEMEAVVVSQNFSLDFDDALHYYVATILDLVLVSFDSDFDHTDIKRIEPSQILLGKR